MNDNNISSDTKDDDDKSIEEKLKIAHEASEKIAEPVAPFGLAREIKTVAETHAKITGKKSWLINNSMDIAIVIGTLWGIGKVLGFYFPNHSIGNWIRAFESFLPLALAIVAIGHRLYPHINIFLTNKK